MQIFCCPQILFDTAECRCTNHVLLFYLFPILLRYNLLTTLYNFEVYNVMILGTHILQNNYHNKVS